MKWQEIWISSSSEPTTTHDHCFVEVSNSDNCDILKKKKKNTNFVPFIWNIVLFTCVQKYGHTSNWLVESDDCDDGDGPNGQRLSGAVEVDVFVVSDSCLVSGFKELS